MENTFVGFLYAVAGILIGGLATHFLSKDITRRNNFNQAAREFIAAFQDELTKLRLEPTSTYDIIKPALIKHGIAYSVFRRYLDGSELEQFISAWRIYYLSTPPCPDDKKQIKNIIAFLKKTKKKEPQLLKE
jgi:hypothetical protein